MNSQSKSHTSTTQKTKPTARTDNLHGSVDLDALRLQSEVQRPGVIALEGQLAVHDDAACGGNRDGGLDLLVKEL